MRRASAFVCTITGVLLAGLLALGCESAFAPANPPILDGDMDGDQEPALNLKLSPDFMRVGDRIKTGTITFKNLDEIREKIAGAEAGYPSWQIDYGKDVILWVVNFDPDTPRFHNIDLSVASTARTGRRVVTVTLDYGNVLIRESGEFFVLPSLESQASSPLKSHTQPQSARR